MLLEGRVGKSTPPALVLSVNVCASSKQVRSAVAPAPLSEGCPAGYSGCAGVEMSGVQLGSAIVSGLLSVSARVIAVTGRHVTSVSVAPWERFPVQVVNI